MSDLISRQDAINAMATWEWHKLYLPIDFKQLLDGVPSAQHFVEVVRCKDCADWQADWIPSCVDNGSHYCGTMDTIMKPNDYCSYGERRTDGEIH